MNNIKLSIIIPVYNAVAYLDKCVTSILSQEFRDFELILVDDGSKDNSGAVCDTYSYSDSRVKVIHKANSGVSDTRNAALDIARGEYIQFCDSDDWITPDSSDLMVKAAEESGADMVIAGFYRVADDRVSQKRGDIDRNGVISLEDFAGYMMESPADYYYGVLWNKLFRKEILDRYSLRMDKNIHWCEDFMFNMEYLRHCEKIYVLEAPVYYYVRREGSLVSQSLTVTKTIQMKSEVFRYYQNFYRNVLSEEDYQRDKLEIYRFLTDAATDGVVFPTIAPHSYRLGKERVNVYGEPSENSGVLYRLSYIRQLFEQEIESAALKNRISVETAEILYCISKLDGPCSIHYFRELTGISSAEIRVNIRKLRLQGYISFSGPEENDSEEWETRYEILGKADEVMKDIAAAEEEFRNKINDKNIRI